MYSDYVGLKRKIVSECESALEGIRRFIAENRDALDATAKSGVDLDEIRDVKWSLKRFHALLIDSRYDVLLHGSEDDQMRLATIDGPDSGYFIKRGLTDHAEADLPVGLPTGRSIGSCEPERLLRTVDLYGERVREISRTVGIGGIVRVVRKLRQAGEGAEDLMEVIGHIARREDLREGFLGVAVDSFNRGRNGGDSLRRAPFSRARTFREFFSAASVKVRDLRRFVGSEGASFSGVGPVKRNILSGMTFVDNALHGREGHMTAGSSLYGLIIDDDAFGKFWGEFRRLGDPETVSDLVERFVRREIPGAILTCRNSRDLMGVVSTFESRMIQVGDVAAKSLDREPRKSEPDQSVDRKQVWASMATDVAESSLGLAAEIEMMVTVNR